MPRPRRTGGSSGSQTKSQGARGKASPEQLLSELNDFYKSTEAWGTPQILPPDGDWPARLVGFEQQVGRTKPRNDKQPSQDFINFRIRIRWDAPEKFEGKISTQSFDTVKYPVKDTGEMRSPGIARFKGQFLMPLNGGIEDNDFDEDVKNCRNFCEVEGGTPIVARVSTREWTDDKGQPQSRSSISILELLGEEEDYDEDDEVLTEGDEGDEDEGDEEDDSDLNDLE